ncbi:hypothetical protein ES707_00119 [subsurface metagenome]
MTTELSQEDVNRIAEAVVEKAAEDVGVRDIMIGSAMGEGAIPLYGRETRKEPCSCCLIDPEGPNAPENRMCTTKSAIGTLSDREEREWCSEIKIVSDGRCARAMAIRKAAKECKEKHPDDTEAFFKCYIPAFSQATRGSNPVAKEPWQLTLEQYALEKGARPAWVKAGYGETYRFHKRAVERAISEGKSVPPEVLADYPGLLKGAK